MAVKLSKRELNALIKELNAAGLEWTSIYLFGSTAKGYATAQSDRDFCILVSQYPKNLKQIDIQINKCLGLKGFNMDILIKTENEFKTNRTSPILHEVRTTGIRVA